MPVLLYCFFKEFWARNDAYKEKQFYPNFTVVKNNSMFLSTYCLIARCILKKINKIR